jgi:hypothetical protein
MRAGRWKVIKQPQAEQQLRQRKTLLQFWNGHRVDVPGFISMVNNQPVLKEHLASRAFPSESRNEFEDLLHWVTDV